MGTAKAMRDDGIVDNWGRIPGGMRNQRYASRCKLNRGNQERGKGTINVSPSFMFHYRIFGCLGAPFLPVVVAICCSLFTNCCTRSWVAKTVAICSQTVAIGCKTRKSADSMPRRLALHHEDLFSVFFFWRSRLCGRASVSVTANVPDWPCHSLTIWTLLAARRGFMDATIKAPPDPVASDLPIGVREAAVFLGVSPQTVYLWVERKRIPHFRVMGRNIRFLKSELQLFRAQFKQEVENWQDQ
jgi:excisionase family DNA binding protein